MLNDRQAEHIPGCNMAFDKRALEVVGGFDPLFTRAGDDVDLCWRLQQAGFKVGFNPAAFVWHYRRSTPLAYLKQQKGYGEAEALLVRKHPEYFNSFGGSIWRGRIYSSSRPGVVMRPSIIYRGTFGGGGFQSLYTSEPVGVLMLSTALEYYVLVCLPLWVLTANWHRLLPVAIAALLLPMAMCSVAGAQARLPANKRRWWSRPLVALLFLLQPIVRGWARYQGRFMLPARATTAGESLDSLALFNSRASLGECTYASATPVDRISFIRELILRLDNAHWPNKPDIGWSTFDVEVYGSRWSSVQITTATVPQEGGSTVLRCKLKPRWSLPTLVLFWSLLAMELLVIGLFADGRPWSWGLLASVPLVLWLVRRQHRELQSRCVALLDALARELGFAKLDNAVPQDATEPVDQADTASVESSALPEDRESAKA